MLTGCIAHVPNSSAAAAASETRIIHHALGESTITGTPQRIVALECTYVEDLLALGIQPLAIADIEGYKDWVKVPIALDPGVVDVGERGEPNLETLTGLKPDLIITAAFRSAENYEQLSAIAPTVAFDAYPTDENVTQYDEMRQTFLTIADLVGRTAEGEAVLAQMEAKFAAARSQLEAAGKLGETFVLAQAFGGDTVQIRLFTDNAMATEIVTQLGLKNGWDGPFDQYGFTTVSIETLPELGDINFFYVVQDDNNVFTRSAIAPLWEKLPFVQNGNAYGLGGDTWLFGGPLSAELVVDKVMEALTGEVVTVASDTVSFVHVVPGGFQLYRAAPNAYAPIAVMTEAGVVRPDFEVGTDETSWERLDWEGIVNLSGDVLFYVVGGADDEASQLEAEVTANPIWQQVPAVQAGQAYRVNAEHWMSFGGLHSAHAVLDDLEKYLTE